MDEQQQLRQLLNVVLDHHYPVRTLVVTGTTTRAIYKPGRRVFITIGSAAICAAVAYMSYKHASRVAMGLARFVRNTLGVRFYSKILDWCATEPLVDYRNEFYMHPIGKVEVKTNHTHGAAAGKRSTANKFIMSYITGVGRKAYDLSKDKMTKIGDHYYYYGKDLAHKAGQFGSMHEAMVKMTDVDYYVDMPCFLNGRDCMLYTFAPTTPGGEIADATYHTDGDDIVMNVNGGGSYRHPLWDYDTDSIITDHWWGSAMYLVDQRTIGDASTGRRVVLLSCKRVVYGPLAWILPGRRLRRRKLTWGQVAYVKEQYNDGKISRISHNFAIPKTTKSCKINEQTLQTVLIRLQLAKTPAVSDIERLLRQHADDDHVTDCAFAASVIFKLFMENNDLIREMTTTTIMTRSCDTDDRGYQTLWPLATEDGKPSARRVTPAIMNESTHPLRSYNNDVACVQGRITKVANQVNEYPPFVFQCLDEFVTLLVPDSQYHTLVPSDYEAQYQQWSRPTQRGFLNSIKHILYCDDIWNVRSFQKAETYAKVTEPRNISTVPTGHNFRLGQFVQVFTDHVLKPTHWYAFGKHPREMSTMMHEKVSVSNTVCDMDISKCDGSMGLIIYLLMRALMLRAFAREYHAEVIKLLLKEAKCKGITSHGYVYEALWNTISGSAITSCRNSCGNAFMNYVALRQLNDSPADCYTRLGLYGGDDGITCDVEPSHMNRVFAQFGMLLKAETIRPGNPVPFLGRLFIDPWTTSESIIDVKRHLIKLHMTVSPMEVPTNVVLHRKAAGYLITDPNTPVISHWCNWVMRNYAPIHERDLERYKRYLNSDVTYWSKFEHPFPTVTSHEQVRKIICENVGCQPDDLDRLCMALDDDDARMLKTANFFQPATKVTVEAQMGGAILPAERSVPHQDQVAANARLPPGKTSKSCLESAKWNLTHTNTVNSKSDQTRQTKSRSTTTGRQALASGCGTSATSAHPSDTNAQALRAANKIRAKKVLPERPNPETRPNIKTCKQFAETGVCSFGGKCKFQHTLADAMRNAVVV